MLPEVLVEDAGRQLNKRAQGEVRNPAGRVAELGGENQVNLF